MAAVLAFEPPHYDTDQMGAPTVLISRLGQFVNLQICLQIEFGVM